MGKVEDKKPLLIAETRQSVLRHDDFFIDVIAGLSDTPKHIPSTYLFDEEGQRIFKQIELLETYYPARIESVILKEHRHEIIPLIGKGSFISEKTLSRLEPEMLLRLLQKIRATIPDRGGILIGIDMECDPALLEATYNDDKGLFSALHKNILSRINNELIGNFDLNSFNYYTHYNKHHHRMEMQLVSLKRQHVDISGIPYDFMAGETIQTSYAYQYSFNRFYELLDKAGLAPVKRWMDKDALCCISYVIPRL